MIASRRRAAVIVIALLSVVAGCGADDRPEREAAQPEPSTRCSSDRRFAAHYWRTPCWRPYATTSPFNRAIGDQPPLARQSASVVSRLTAWGPPQNLLIAHADRRSDYFHPLYWSHKEDPIFRIRCLRYLPCSVEGHRVRIPEAARPAAGGDGHLAVIDQHTGWEYDFWQVRDKPSGGGTLVVSHGGRTRIDGDGLGSNATAASFGLAAGIIRAAELRAGRIDHALFAQVKCTSGQSVYPAEPGGTGAVCARFGMSNVAAPALGARFWLDLSEQEIAQLDVPEWKRTILRALARYGMIVGDTNNGNASWGLQVESGSTYTSFGKRDPWSALAKRFAADRDGDTTFLALDGGVDWAAHLHQVAPCVSSGRC